MVIHAVKGLVGVLVCGLLVAGAAAAAGSPPPPKSPTGRTVTQIAAGGGLATPTSFAFGDGKIFEGDAGRDEQGAQRRRVRAHERQGRQACRLAGSTSSGLAWHGGSLVRCGRLDHGQELGHLDDPEVERAGPVPVLTAQKAIYTAPKKFEGFDGIAFGPSGRLYAGVAVQGCSITMTTAPRTRRRICTAF